jgi:uncharacterized protein
MRFPQQNVKGMVMKILFSPSETKTNKAFLPAINEKSFIFRHLYEKRMEVIGRYQDIIQKQDIASLSTLFGIKDAQKCLALSHINLFSALTCKAIERYDGVAYDYLHYPTLLESAQNFIDHHVLIFSNLFGPLLAGENIPEYKLSQGETLEGFKPELFYKEAFSPSLDAMLEDEFIVDLRAGFYEKFYTIKKPFVTAKFLKNGKVVSHFAKAYRGKMLRQLSISQPQNEEAFQKINFEHLKIVEILKTKFKSEYVFDIVD